MRAWGWDEQWEAVLQETRPEDAEPAEDTEPARVVSQGRDRWTVQAETTRVLARIAHADVQARPTVGDWVLVRPGPLPRDPWSIRAVLPRRSAFTRGAAGTRVDEQTVAANVDRVWIVHGLDLAPNARRLERYLALAWESGAAPEIVLTKADVATDREDAVSQVEALAFGVPVRVVSVVTGEGLRELEGTLQPAGTVALLGPSGVGKSSLVNRLASEEVATTGAVRAGDRRGRHTTTRRELFRVANGALLLDTPGLRELKVREVDEGLERTFPEIDELAAHCRFRDCAHASEPGCAVLAAVDSGEVPRARLESYRKLVAEAAYQARKTDPVARAELAAEHKSIMKSLRLHPKYRDR